MSSTRFLPVTANWQNGVLAKDVNVSLIKINVHESFILVQRTDNYDIYTFVIHFGSSEIQLWITLLERKSKKSLKAVWTASSETNFFVRRNCPNSEKSINILEHDQGSMVGVEEVSITAFLI